MDTKKTKKVKLRGGPVIEVSQQIFNWRKKRKAAKAANTLHNAPGSSNPNTSYNELGLPINDEPEPVKAQGQQSPWDMFK